MDARFEIKTLSSLNFLLPLIILIEGFVSISIEIITIRQLLPVAGGSVIVTSLIIGIFLLFLALGYKRGGRVTKDLQKKLAYNFLLAALWLGIGLSYTFIMSFFNIFDKITGPHVIYPLLAYLLIIIAPLVFILGQTMPISMHMRQHNKTVGMVGGDTMSLSTMGSFLGATVTSLIFMHYFGVAWTILINCLLLFILFLLLMAKQNYFLLWTIFAATAIWIAYGFNIEMENKLFVLTNHYANYQILTNKNFNLRSDEKILSINNSLSSFTNAKNKCFAYVEFIKNILFNQLQLHNANILVLGAGGFTFSADGDHNNNITYVDIDHDLKNVVLSKFLKEIKGTLIVDDARHYVHVDNKKYEAIVVDVFTNVRSIPATLLTFEFMRDLQRRLTVNGVAIFNMITKPTLSDPYSKRIDNTIRSVFRNCMVIPGKFGDHATNVLYVCNNTNNQKDNTIYSDDLNNSTTDSFEW